MQTAPSLDHVKDTFRAFREESIWLRSVYEMTMALFSSDSDVDALLKRTAPHFFGDLNHVMIEYWILVVSRLTDPARTGKRENLTASLLIEQLQALGLCSPEIQATAARLQPYRTLLNDARNRAVSHADKETFLNPALLGEHRESEIGDFLNSLQSFNDLVGEAVGDGPLDFRSTNGPGDVHDLLRCLRDAPPL